MRLVAHVPIALAYSKIYTFLFNDNCFHCTKFKSYRTITQVCTQLVSLNLYL